MPRLLRHHLALPLALLSCLAAGCGGADRQMPGRADELREVYDLYRATAEQARKPPTKLADLDLFEPRYANGFAAVRDGRCEVVWGTPLTADPGAVLAYDKAAPQQGGDVLLADGTVKRMSAEEFQTAPRAAAH
jgi:hypothetical protein